MKTLADAEAKKVNFSPKRTSISALRRLAATHGTSRAPGPERATYRITGRLVEMKQEDDHDFHLVVADPKHPARTLIVEFPARSCTHSFKRHKMAGARSAFAQACGRPPKSSFQFLRGRATITGVGFFDFDHGQTGVAPNAIELHPVLRFKARGCAASRAWGRLANYRAPAGSD